jgi:hypothetical protein
MIKRVVFILPCAISLTLLICVNINAQKRKNIRKATDTSFTQAKKEPAQPKTESRQKDEDIPIENADLVIIANVRADELTFEQAWNLQGRTIERRFGNPNAQTCRILFSRALLTETLESD